MTAPTNRPWGGKRWEYVVGKALKDWASRIMEEGHTRAEARGMILQEIKNKTNPPGEVIIRIKRFVRVPFLWGWTIGWDWKNRAILQFTKTIPFKPGYRNWSLWFIRYSFTSKSIEYKESRTWINIGWNV